MVTTLVFALAVPGCASIFGHCPPTATMDWVEPGIYAAMTNASAALRAPEGGFHFAQAGQGDAMLTRVSWRPYEVAPSSERAVVEAALDVRDADAPRVTVALPPHESNETMRALFRAFMANVSAAPADTLRAWEDALIAQRQPTGWRMSDSGVGLRPVQDGSAVDVTGPFRLDEFFVERGGVGTFAVSRGTPTPGALHLRGAQWSWELAVAMRTVSIETAEGTVDLVADAADQASFTLERSEGKLSDDAGARAAVREALRKLGVPDPTGPPQVVVMVC